MRIVNADGMSNNREGTEANASDRKELASAIRIDSEFTLESGDTLAHLDIAYETYGTLNSEGSNAILVCHALTGSAHAAGGPVHGMPGWWDGIIGRGKALDTDRYCVICTNILGSCYGTTGPTSTNPRSGSPYRTRFPDITVRDMVRAQKLLLDRLGVSQLQCITGGSLGGMQVLEWAILYPEFVRAIVPIATSAQHSAWCIGISEAQRLAIVSDPDWLGGDYDRQPYRGLAQARMIAMISYRSRASFDARFGRDRTVTDRSRDIADRPGWPPVTFQVESYLRYQGQKLVARFDANTYLTLTRSMDLHDVARGRGSVQDALGSIRAKTLCVGISSDILYPAVEQGEICGAIPGARYAEIDSIHGHDAFLIEDSVLNEMIPRFLE